MTISRHLPSAAALLLALVSVPSAAQPVSAPAAVLPAYAETAALVLAAPVAVVADIARATPLKGAQAAGVAPGMARLYVEAQVVALIRGPGVLPARISYLVDLPLDSANRPPKLKKLRVLLLAAPVPDRPAELRLVGPGAQMPWSPAAEARVRAIITEAIAPAAPPAITGITGAFHVPGSLPGESETQIFLKTADARPISLSVLRRPGEQPRWAVALGEMVDNSAAPPRPESLLWYRLACGLPAALPAAATASLGPAERAAAEADYQLVLRGLGPCGIPR